MTLEWLATGQGANESVPPYNSDKQDLKNTKTAWQLMFEMLEPEEAKALLRLIHRKGIEYILRLDSEK